MSHASKSDQAYFARVARENRMLADEIPPASLRETLARLDAIRRSLGPLALPGVIRPDDDGDLAGHLAYLAHIRAVMQRHGNERA